MTRRLVKDSAAESDLLEVWLYTLRKWDLAQADRYIDGFEAVLAQLRVEPHRGNPRESLRPGTWSKRIPCHVDFYTFTQTELRVRRVLHSAMDPGEHL